jgi:transcriptional regulator of NAD metabolism
MGGQPGERLSTEQLLKTALGKGGTMTNMVHEYGVAKKLHVELYEHREHVWRRFA